MTLTSGRTAQYYVDAKRAILRPAGFRALAELVAGHAARLRATAVGGLTMGADAPACAALAGGAEVKAFFVRKETKAHGLQRRIEGPTSSPASAAWSSRTSSPPAARPSRRSRRCARPGTRSAASSRSSTAWRAAPTRSPRRPAGAPYEALATIDDIYPDRPDARANAAYRDAVPLRLGVPRRSPPRHPSTQR